ncbi:MAG: EAL domain-containing protein [Gammaproteobacteria bacterium]
MQKVTASIESEMRAKQDKAGRDYRNPHCYLGRRGIKLYRRCDYCTLKTNHCVGLQSNTITILVGVLLSAFLVINSSFLILCNIIGIVMLMVALGYKVSSNLDRLALADHMNVNLNEQLKNYADNLETKVQSRTRELEDLVRTDALTGLASRIEFERQLKTARESVHQNEQQHALLFLNLDQFRVVNDIHGHIAGDELLRQITPFLLEDVRKNDTVARFGSDEFAILLWDCKANDAIHIAGKILQSLENFRFIWKDSTFAVSASIGIIGLSRESGSTIDLLSAVDSACCQAKDLGGNRVHVYEHNAEEIDKRRDEMQFVSLITHALDENRFELHYQPIVPLSKQAKHPRHYEVLIRMLDEDGKLIPPMAFLPAAERFNLMHNIDRWVIKAAFQSYQALIEIDSTMLSINLSGASLTDEHLLEYITQQLSCFGVPADMIVFEITETAAITNLNRARVLIDSLRELGCQISLDDFGSGLSSFAYLKNLPVDNLKIDGSFVKDMLDDDADCAMVEAINNVGHRLGKRTIAEFVENDSIFNALRDMGIDYAQGYGIGKPVPLKDIVGEGNSENISNIWARAG